jgi:hypothetical protein
MAAEHEVHGASAFRFHAWGYDYVIWPSEIIGLAIFVFVFWAFWKAHKSKRNPIDFGDAFVWPQTKHTSLAFIMAFMAAMTGLWMVIDQELKNRLNETFALGVLGMLILGKLGTETVNAWRTKAPPPVAPPTPSPPPNSSPTT